MQNPIRLLEHRRLARLTALGVVAAMLVAFQPAPVVAAAPAKPPTLYASWAKSPSDLATIDIGTGATTAIGPLAGVSNVFGMACDPRTGTLYGALSTGPNDTTILEVDRDTAAISPLGLVGERVSAMSFDRRSGQLVTIGSASRDLYLFDPATGTVTNEGATGVLGVEGLSIHPDGTLYATSLSATEERLYRIDIGSSPPTGMLVSTLQPADYVPDPGFRQIGRAFAIHPDGVFYMTAGFGPGVNLLVTVDPATGLVSSVAPTPNVMEGFAFCPAPKTEELVCDGSPVTIVGTVGDDTLIGTAGRDVIHGLTGDDTIYGLAGNDTICGGDGEDVLRGGPGVDTLRGGRNADRLFGGPGADQLYGFDGDDFLSGGLGNDTLRGQNGADELHGGGSQDLLIGGTGDDTLWGGGGADELRGSTGYDIGNGGPGNDTCESIEVASSCM